MAASGEASPAGAAELAPVPPVLLGRAALREPEPARGQSGVKRRRPQPAKSGSDVDLGDCREPALLMQFLLCAVSALEGADTQLLGASMKALQEDIGLRLLDVSYMTMAQMVCTNLAAPFWGIMADRGILKRRTILMLGCMGQCSATVLLAFAQSSVPMIFFRAVAGTFLAALRPISNGIIADVTAEQKRGKIFGRVQSALLVGMFVTTMAVVPVATETVMGFHGWRVAFICIGLMSATITTLVFLFLEEPPHHGETEASSASGCAAVAEELRGLLRFFKIPTFCIMIMQGIFGTIPWSIMGYMTLYFQLTGIDNGRVAVLTGAQPIAGAAGNVIGGLVADFLARRFLLHGRPLSAQITVACGIPLVFLIFYGVPAGSGGFGVYLCLIVAFGLLGSWAQSGTNFPILSHIVPAKMRSRVMAWECALENSIANALGPLVVSLLAERAFGYTFGEHGGRAGEGADLESARALGKAMTFTICIPWLVCFAAYSLLHWSYPRDVRKLELHGKEAAEGANPDCQEDEEEEASSPYDHSWLEDPETEEATRTIAGFA